MHRISERVSYKRELDCNYLLMRQENYKDEFQLGMLVKNRIPGLLSCRLHLSDGSAELCYEITSRQSLRLMLERKRLSYEEFRLLLEGILKAVESSREYLLNPNHILLDPEYIYLDPDTWNCFFCCFPYYEGDIREELVRLAEYLLERLKRQDQKAVSLGYEFYRAAGEENLSLWEVLGGQEKERKEYPGQEEQKREQDLEAWEGDDREEGLIREKEKGSLEQKVVPGTQILVQEKGDCLILRGKNPAHPKLEVTGDSFLIGKKKDAVDGFIKARGISRIHARITKEEGVYYLADLNSTNGTFLNGGRLEVHEKARIRPGDSVGFGEVEYVVEG